jgi:acyl-CoA reductase-like NAD-dependent aldehyde dehydrogenase
MCPVGIAATMVRIGGVEREGIREQYVIDPRTGEPAFTVALAGEADLDDALAAAAASPWPRVLPEAAGESASSSPGSPACVPPCSAR